VLELQIHAWTWFSPTKSLSVATLIVAVTLTIVAAFRDPFWRPPLAVLALK
jgi:hypothetical protein